MRAVVTTRAGGFSAPPFDSFNLAGHVGDDPGVVERNRRLLRRALNLPKDPVWLNQVHGTRVIDAASASGAEDADAAWTDREGVVCAVMTADCLPVFFSALDGSSLAVAHAGWRGLAAGVLEAALAAMPAPPDQVICWLGPAIGPEAFEVGPEVRNAFVENNSDAASAFSPGSADKWLADIYQLAAIRLRAAGVSAVHGGGFCTWSEPERFFSYRRNARTGRMASLIWKAGKTSPPRGILL